MGEIVPIFKSHYSLGRSILTLNTPKEEADTESNEPRAEGVHGPAVWAGLALRRIDDNPHSQHRDCP